MSETEKPQPELTEEEIRQAEELKKAKELLRLLNEAFRATVTGGNVKYSPGIGILTEGDWASLLEAIASTVEITSLEAPSWGVDADYFMDHGKHYFWRFDYRPISEPEDFEVVRFRFSIKTAEEQTTEIRNLNDRLRKYGVGGDVMAGLGFSELPEPLKERLIERVKKSNHFDTSSDPSGEHKVGTVKHRGETYYWQIDYYDLDLKWGSSDPSDLRITRRVLTLMTSEDM